MTTSAPTRNEAKAARELAVFAAFVKSTRPDINEATIESRDGPQPDIACATFEGGRLAFELVELCPPDIVKAVGDLKRTGGVTDLIWTADPCRQILMKKLRKR